MTNILEKIEKYLVNEDDPEKKIYFAHPQKYYRTKGETQAIQMINKKGPQYVIINPTGKQGDRRAKKLGFKPFYQAVDRSEIVVVMPLEGNLLSGGAYKEVVKGEQKGKDIGIIRPWKNELKPISVSKLKAISKNDPYYKQFFGDED